MKFSILGLIFTLATQQSHAVFFFCESRLIKDYGLSQVDARSLCNSPFSNSIKQSIKEESKDNMKKVLSILLAAKIDSSVITYDDAMKKVKSSTDLELRLFASYAQKFGFKRSIDLTKDIKEADKQEALLKILDDIKWGTISFDDIKSFLKKASANQISAFASLSRQQYAINPTKWSPDNLTKLILAIPPEKLEFAKKFFKDGFWGLDSSVIESPSAFLKYINSSSKKFLSCLSKIGTYASEMCSKYDRNELCGPKASMLSLLLEGTMHDYQDAIADNLINNNHFTENHLKIFKKLFFAPTDKINGIPGLLQRDTINDNETHEILEELESPVPDYQKVEIMLYSGSSIYEKGIKFSGLVPACGSSKEEQKAINVAIANVYQECDKYYSSKKGLECIMETDGRLCGKNITLQSKFLKDNLKSCDTESLKDILTKSINNKPNITDIEIETNDDSRSPKEIETRMPSSKERPSSAISK